MDVFGSGYHARVEPNCRHPHSPVPLSVNASHGKTVAETLSSPRRSRRNTHHLPVHRGHTLSPTKNDSLERPLAIYSEPSLHDSIFGGWRFSTSYQPILYPVLDQSRCLQRSLVSSLWPYGELHFLGMNYFYGFPELRIRYNTVTPRGLRPTSLKRNTTLCRLFLRQVSRCLL